MHRVKAIFQEISRNMMHVLKEIDETQIEKVRSLRT